MFSRPQHNELRCGECCYDIIWRMLLFMQVKELINMRDRCMNAIFKRGECNDIIEFLYAD